MGGYLLTNNHSESVEENICRLCEDKGVQKQSVQLGNYRLYLFQMINQKDRRLVFEEDTTKIIGIGTLIYGNAIGYKALELLYRDLKSNDFDYSLFNSVKGHFNIIIENDNNLSIVADRSGTYHSFISNTGGHIYVSNSFLAILDNLDDINLRKQEIMEFIVTQAFYGPRTIVEEIDFLEFGHVHQFDDSENIRTKKYHEEGKELADYGLEEHYQAIIQHLTPLKFLDISISSEISAGFDSRLVCAALNHMGIEYTLNTNTNSYDSLDTKIAMEIAEGEGREIRVYYKDIEKIPYEDLIRESPRKTELYRDAFGASYSSIFFDEKTRDFDMILGGYGGELYRDTKYKGIETYTELLQQKYMHRDVADIFSKEDITSFGKNMINKMKIITGNSADTVTKRDCELVYYHQRMMYWGGARITNFNYYGYRYHPLLEYEIIHPLFYVEENLKNMGKFQMLLTERFDKKLAGYRSGYGHNFIWSDFSRRKQDSKKGSVYGLLKQVGKRFVKGKPTTPENEDREVWHKIMGSDFLITELFEGIRPKGNEKYLGRIFTIENILRTYKEKISSIN